MEEVIDRNDEALYHLQKIIGLAREAQKHADALWAMGIDVFPIENATEVVVRSGIEKFGIPLKGKRVKSFEHCGVEIWQ